MEFKKVSINFEQNEDSLKEEQLLDTRFLELNKFKLGQIISMEDYSKTYKVISKKNWRSLLS